MRLTRDPARTGAQAVKARTTQTTLASRSTTPSPSQPVSDPDATKRKPSRRPPLSGKKKPDVKPLAGSVQEHHGWWTLRLRVDGRQPRIKLGLVGEMSEARANEKAAAWLERMASEGRGAPTATPAGTTVRAHFDSWISGEMFRKHGAVNGLKIKSSADVDRWRAEKYVYPAIGKKLVADVTEQDIDAILAKIPSDRRAGTRDKIVSLLRRGFDLAIVPARLRTTNPVTRYHKPAKDAPKLFAYLFPAELLALLSCTAIPLGRRVLYALACYLGLRKSSLLSLRWKGANLEQRTILSRVSKTGIAQLFEIPPGIVWVLQGWYEVQGRPDADAFIIPPDELHLRGGGRAQGDQPRSEAAALRADLRAAGITRSELFDAGPNVEPLRFHDLRATFNTWAKRAGKSDGWISDRTGHLTPEMIQRYTRAARTLEDLRIEPFPELTGTIPELVEALAGKGGPPKRGPAGEPGTPPPMPTTTDDGSSGSGGTRAHACAHADLNVVDRG
jgi:integrase